MSRRDPFLGYNHRMTYSFSLPKRQGYNQALPAVQSMLAVADTYGVNSGSPSDKELFSDLFKTFAHSIPGAQISNIDSLAASLAAETVRSKYPTAVSAAWATASLLPNATVRAMGNTMGNAGVAKAATWFTDEFPGQVKAPVLGRRTKMWRVPAAIAAVILISHAEEIGL